METTQSLNAIVASLDLTSQPLNATKEDLAAANTPIPQQDRIRIFINGIMNDSTSAAGNAGYLQEKRQFPQGRMLVLYSQDNTHGAIQSIGQSQSMGATLINLVGAFLDTAGQHTVAGLASDVRKLAERGYVVEIHAHSRGSFVLNQALTQLRQLPNWAAIKSQLHVNTYGAVTLIEVWQAATVNNYVNLQDHFASVGTTLLYHSDARGRHVVNGASTALTLATIDWLKELNHPPTGDNVDATWLRQTEYYEVRPESLLMLALTARIRSWGGDAHGFTEYVDHIDADPDPSEQKVKLLVTSAIAIAGTLMMLRSSGSQNRNLL